MVEPTDADKCNQKNCGLDAEARVYWPGNSEPLLMCAAHVAKAQSIAGVLGMGLCVKEIRDAE